MYSEVPCLKEGMALFSFVYGFSCVKPFLSQCSLYRPGERGADSPLGGRALGFSASRAFPCVSESGSALRGCCPFKVVKNGLRGSPPGVNSICMWVLGLGCPQDT